MIRLASPDGRWTFENGVMRSGEIRVPVCEMDFFKRWTFARFLPGGALALAFETSQPWSEWGSYGDPYRGAGRRPHARWRRMGAGRARARHPAPP